MLVLRVPGFRPLEFRLLFFCGRHVSPRSTQLRQLRAQVPGVIRELLDVADGLKLRLPGGWSLVQMGPRESQALLHLRRYLRRCRRPCLSEHCRSFQSSLTFLIQQQDDLFQAEDALRPVLC